jgi:hypothetical protein
MSGLVGRGCGVLRADPVVIPHRVLLFAGLPQGLLLGGGVCGVGVGGLVVAWVGVVRVLRTA